MGAVNDPKGAERVMPKSLRHKRVLDLAGERPEASLEDIADEVPSATTDLVERVLDEYGDPAEEDDHLETDDEERLEPNDDEDSSETTDDYADPTTLTSAQRTTLGALLERPEATQRELAEEIGVTASTVCNRLNAIEGFDWSNRRAIANEILDVDDDEPDETSTMETNGTRNDAAIEQLRTRITTLEQQLEDDINTNGSSTNFDDPELVHKVMHACLTSEQISEDEELQILKGLL